MLFTVRLPGDGSTTLVRSRLSPLGRGLGCAQFFLKMSRVKRASQTNSFPVRNYGFTANPAAVNAGCKRLVWFGTAQRDLPEVLMVNLKTAESGSCALGSLYLSFDNTAREF